MAKLTKKQKANAINPETLHGVDQAIAAFAAAGRPKQVEQEPDRQDHHQAEQRVRHRPGKTAAGPILQLVVGQAGFPDQLLGSDPEVVEDRSDDQGGDHHLDQRADQRIEHPGPVTGGAPAH